MPSRQARPARQLLLDLGREPSFASEDFLVSPANEAAAAVLQAWPNWPSRTMLLVGPPGSGKSHLAAIWAGEVGATALHAGATLGSSLWDGGDRRVLLEDCDRAAHGEAALFHALNLVNETGGWLLATARTPPDQWRIGTPDLLSRLRLAPVANLGRPDTLLLKAVAIKLFADRQIRIEDDVVSYAARHCEQSLEAVARFVAAVDDAALSAGRRITRSLAIGTLARLQTEAPPPGRAREDADC